MRVNFPAHGSFYIRTLYTLYTLVILNNEMMLQGNETSCPDFIRVKDVTVDLGGQMRWTRESDGKTFKTSMVRSVSDISSEFQTAKICDSCHSKVADRSISVLNGTTNQMETYDICEDCIKYVDRPQLRKAS